LPSRWYAEETRAEIAPSRKAGNLLKSPVLLLGWIPRIVIPIARSLDAYGIPVDVADFALAPPARSQSIREFRRIPRPDQDRCGFVTQAREFIRQSGHDMVIPTDDQSLLALSTHRQDLQDLALIASPPPDTTALVLNKCSTLEIARRCGLAIPTTKLISSSEELFDLFPTFPFPWILKPARKEVWVEETKSYSFATPQEVRARFPVARKFATPMLLQEYCAGDGVGVEMLMHQGKALAIFQHRRLRELPHTGGVSVTAIAEDVDPLLAERSRAVLQALQWEGPAMVEFKIGYESGSPVFMEVNGRYWGTIGLAIAAGIDFPLYHWQLVHGEVPVIPDAHAVGTKWVWTAGHMARLHGLLLKAAGSFRARKELLRSLAALPGELGGATCHSLLDPSDSMPALLHALQMIRFLVRQDVNGLSKRLRSSRQSPELHRSAISNFIKSMFSDARF